MKIFYRLLFIIVVLGLCPSLSAQTVCWEYKPEYDEIRRMTPEMFVFKKDNVVSLVKDQKTFVQINASIITDFVNGSALVLDREESTAGDPRYKLVGIIDEEGFNFHSALHKNYTFYVDRYAFVSDQRIPVYVVDESGQKKYGFLSGEAQLVSEMKYKDILPFVNGNAYVCETKKNKDVWSVVNKDFGKAKTKLKREKLQEEYADRADINRYLDVVSQGQNLPLDPNILIVAEKGLFGYKRSDGNWVAPTQFNRAEPFSGGFAVVENNRGCGVIRIQEGSFSCEQTPGGLTDNGYQTTLFTVTIPEIYKDSKISLRCLFKDESKNDKFPIPLKPVNEDDPTVLTTSDITVLPDEKTVEITVENMVLYRQFFEKDVPEDLDAVKLGLSASKLRADSGNKAKVTVTVTNTSDQTLNLTAHASGKSVSVSRSKLTIKPHGSQSFTVTYSNVLSTSSCSISVSGETDKKVKVKAKSVGVQVNPFL